MFDSALKYSSELQTSAKKERKKEKRSVLFVDMTYEILETNGLS